jgi:hypothetical protein
VAGRVVVDAGLAAVGHGVLGHALGDANALVFGLHRVNIVIFKILQKMHFYLKNGYL